MKYLDEGFKYKVYLVENDRVFKKEIPYLIRLFKIFKITRSRNFSFLKSISIAINSDRKNKKSFNMIIEKIRSMNRSLFANPDFIRNTSDFMQDKVLTVKDYLKKIITKRILR